MIQNKKKFISTIFGVFFCLLAANYEIERIMKQPFTNELNFHEQIFNSPLNIVFLTSGIIWACGSIWKFCISKQCDHSLKKKKSFQKSAYFEEQQRENFYKVSIEKQLTRKQISQEQPITLNDLSYMQMIKIVIPKFFQVICFFYGVKYLSFPKILVFSILSKLGILSIYESLFANNQKKCAKFMIGLLTFLGFGLFMYLSPEKQNDQSNDKNQRIYGYMFAIGMCYSGVIKKILLNQVTQQQGQLSCLDSISIQAKTNCILAYLLSVYLNQQIYGTVFAVLHTQFIWNAIGFSLILFAGLLMKDSIKKSHPELEDFIVILQKNLSVIVSLFYFGHEVNQALILSICIIACMALMNYLIQFISAKQIDETPQINQEEQHTTSEDQISSPQTLIFMAKERINH